MKSLLLALFLVACESYESPVGIFESVPASTPVIGKEVSPEWAFPDEVRVYSSDELGKGFKEQLPIPDIEPLTEQVAQEVAKITVEEPIVHNIPVKEIVVEKPAVLQFMAQQEIEGWPISLVTTIPEAQPPRAILRLPEGKEIVVTPGFLLEEHGIVVMSIGKNTVDLAKIVARGDSAVVYNQTLHALN